MLQRYSNNYAIADMMIYGEYTYLHPGQIKSVCSRCVRKKKTMAPLSI